MVCHHVNMQKLIQFTVTMGQKVNSNICSEKVVPEFSKT